MRSQALSLEPKVGPKWDPNRVFDAEALRNSLGGLLERSWSLLEPKKQSWNRSWPLLEASQDSFQQNRGPKWDPKKSPAAHFLLFQGGVQNWTLILWLSKGILRLSKNIFKGCPTHFLNSRWQANKGFILQLPLWNAVPPSKPRPERGGTAVSGRMAFRIRRPPLVVQGVLPGPCLRLRPE